MGGEVFSGMMAVDAIVNTKIPIYTIIEGYAASAATYLSIVGKKRFMTKHSYVLVHQISAAEYGKFETLKDSHKNNKKIMTDMKKLYIEKTNLKSKELDEILKHDIWWNIDECIKHGLVDEEYQA